MCGALNPHRGIKMWCSLAQAGFKGQLQTIGPLDCKRAQDNAVTGPSKDRYGEGMILVSHSKEGQSQCRPAADQPPPACAMGGCRLRPTP
jgi:hypothetical protein